MKKNLKLSLAITASIMSMGSLMATEPTVIGPNGVAFSGDRTSNITTNSGVMKNYVDSTINNKDGEPGHMVVGQTNIVETQEDSSSVFGNQNYVNGKNADAYGDANNTTGELAQAFGDDNLVNGKEAMAFGQKNVIGSSFTYQNRKDPNDPQVQPDVEDRRADGESQADGATVVGNANFVSAKDSITLGKNNKVGVDASSEIVTTGLAPSVGDTAARLDGQTQSDNAVTIGNDNNVKGDNNTTLGQFNKVGIANPTREGVALGFKTQVNQDYGVAIGSNAQVNAADKNDSVALGHNAIANGAKETAGQTYSIGPANGTKLEFNGSFFAGSTAAGVVSVGNSASNTYRQITNVAAGNITPTSTDAINGSQLFTTNAKIRNLADTTAKAISPNSTVDGNGNLTANINVAGNTYNNVEDAINSLGPAQQAKEVNNLNNRVDGLDSRVDGVNSRVTSLDHKMKKAVAGAYAVAALHPLDFNPDDKWSFAVGYGNYAGKNATAIGTFYQPNEDMLLSFGTSMGNGENGYNAGLSFKVGRGQHVNTTRVAMAKEIVDLRKENQDLKDRLDKIEQRLNNPFGALDPNKLSAFPDTPENHWAYQYVATLKGNGLLEGYPDGTFKGDQAMTRYEWATVFYRALMNGAPIDNNMNKALKEFSPEIQDIAASRVRVDRISGQDNDRNKVERAHVNNEDKKIKDIYGSTITPKQK